MAPVPDQASRAPSPGARLAAFLFAFGNELADLMQGPEVASLPADARDALDELRRGYELASELIYEAQLPMRNHRLGLRELLLETLAAVSARELDTIQGIARWRADWFGEWRKRQKPAERRTPFAPGERDPAA